MPIFGRFFIFSTFIHGKKIHNVGFGFLLVRGVRKYPRKKVENQLFSDKVFEHYQNVPLGLGIPETPIINHNSPSSRFYAHFAKTFFSKSACFGLLGMYIYILGFFGTVSWTPFGPNGYFSTTFWHNPSLLGLLRSLKKNFGQNAQNQKV